MMSDTDKAVSYLNVGASFADFYAAELDGQVRRAALLTGSSEIAQDVVHDAFTEIFRRWNNLDNPGPYLNRAVLNRCRDVGRSRYRRGLVHSRLIDVESMYEPEPIADLLDTLPFNQRAAIVLRFYVGLSNIEIADALNCPRGSVGPWIDRALKQLRKVMP
jgi:RNA polymerase sigma factor (sigma-70 family)